MTISGSIFSFFLSSWLVTLSTEESHVDILQHSSFMESQSSAVDILSMVTSERHEYCSLPHLSKGWVTSTLICSARELSLCEAIGCVRSYFRALYLSGDCSTDQAQAVKILLMKWRSYL